MELVVDCNHMYRQMPFSSVVNIMRPDATVRILEFIVRDRFSNFASSRKVSVSDRTSSDDEVGREVYSFLSMAASSVLI